MLSCVLTDINIVKRMYTHMCAVYSCRVSSYHYELVHIDVCIPYVYEGNTLIYYTATVYLYICISICIRIRTELAKARVSV